MPENIDDLIVLGTDAAGGAHLLGSTLGLVANTEAALQADTDDLVTTKDIFDRLWAGRTTPTAAVRNATSNGRGWLLQERDHLKKYLGTTANALWEGPGWSAESIAVPTTSGLVLARLISVKNYLTANPAHEVASEQLTAARAETLRAALVAARTGRGTNGTELDAALAARDAAAEKLRARLRSLLGELATKIGPLSPHWITFGFKKPGAPPAPDKVLNTRLTPLGGGRVRVQGDPSARADYFQVYLQIIGVDAEPRSVYSPRDPDYILENLPVGAQIEVKLRAVNETNEGPFGDPVRVTVT